MVQKQVVCHQSYTWNNLVFVPCTTKQQSNFLALKIDILPPVANYSAILFSSVQQTSLFPIPYCEGCCLQFPILFND